MPPIVALLTDFGLQDHYVGATKGAVLAACPEAQIVDIVHDLPPHDIEAASLALEGAYESFPAGTVFLAVVDPGVGSSRRALALEAGGYRFVGPDNGIFTSILTAKPEALVHEITNAGLFRNVVSATFHARDVFGPVAGRLAQGMPLAEVGPLAAGPCLLARPQVHRSGNGEWEATVVLIDRFGNLITNLTGGDLSRILSELGEEPAEVVVTVEGFVLPLATTYSDVAAGEPCALLGSSGRLEVAVNGDSAARLLGAARGTPVRLRAARPTGP